MRRSLPTAEIGDGPRAISGAYDFGRDRYLGRGAGAIARAQAELPGVAGRVMLMTASDYAARGGPAGGRRAGTARANACAARALPYVSDIGLRGVPAPPIGC